MSALAVILCVAFVTGVAKLSGRKRRRRRSQLLTINHQLHGPYRPGKRRPSQEWTTGFLGDGEGP